jgi:S-formylglutathione hydrolase
LQTVSANHAFGGVQGVYTHPSGATGTDMSFSVYVPPHPEGIRLPVVWYLSGLTCTHANVTEKGEFRRSCAELGLIFVAPDTSPRGADIPDDPAGAYDFGLGAGFYVDATEQPFARHYRMWRYVTEELPALIAARFPADMARQSIMGHSMGGHGALTMGLTYPDRFKAASAFSPIVAPTQVPWGQKALRGYLGDNMTSSRTVPDGRICWLTKERPTRFSPASYVLNSCKMPVVMPGSTLLCGCRAATTIAIISFPRLWRTICTGTRIGSARVA